MNEKHFHGSECSICQNTLRYRSSHNCVACAKQRATKRYENKVGGVPPRRESSELRLKAELAGLEVYQGKPCSNGHNGLRLSKDGRCYECTTRRWHIYPATRIKNARNRAKPENKEKANKYRRDWYVVNKDYDSDYRTQKRALTRKAIPAWSNAKARRDVYRLAKKLTEETGIPHHVDHIVPLKSKYVCGLHCEDNLRAIPATDNMRKRNCWWPDMGHAPINCAMANG